VPRDDPAAALPLNTATVDRRCTTTAIKNFMYRTMSYLDACFSCFKGWRRKLQTCCHRIMMCLVQMWLLRLQLCWWSRFSVKTESVFEKRLTKHFSCYVKGEMSKIPFLLFLFPFPLLFLFSFFIF
jgi:hypothetical protein